MKHQIDPKVDCVFKAILGDEDHTHLLIHFLNAILLDELKSPVVWVEILNPYNEKETRQDKLSIVDVKATVVSPKAKPRTMIGRLLGRS